MLLAGAGCKEAEDPCGSYRLACLSVTVSSGPEETYQLLVHVKDYGSTSPLTPRKMSDTPLLYPLRFAIRFVEFADNYEGRVRVNVSALDRAGGTVGQAEAEVELGFEERRSLHMSLGAPFDMARPQDLAYIEDLSAGDDLSAADDLAGGPLGD